MKRSRFSEEQIIAILREHEAGVKADEASHKHRISSAMFYRWKAKYGGMNVSDARCMKALEDENSKLKRLLAETMLDNAILKEIAAKDGDARRQARSRGARDCGLRREPAAGVPGDQGRAQFDALPASQAG